MFRRLTKEKAALERETDQGKNVGTFHGSKTMYRFRFLGKEKPKKSQCVSVIVCIEIDVP